MKNETLKAIVKAMGMSHPHYLGEEFHMSIQSDYEFGFRIELYAPSNHKEFFTAYALEVAMSIERLYNTNVAVRCKHGVPIITISK